jgi:O-antigen ligase
MRNLWMLLSEKRDILFLSLVAYLPVSRAVFFVRDRTNRALEDYATVDLQNSINIVAVAIMFSLIVRPKTRVSDLRLLRGPTQWMVIYLAFCLLSCVWSAKPLYVAYQATEMIAVLFFMGYILDKIGEPRDGILYLCRFCAVTAFLPYLGWVLRTGQIIQHTNAYSTCGAFGAAMALAAIRRGVLRFAEVKYSLIACLAAVVFGTSSASNVSLLIGILMVAAASRRGPISVAKLAVLAVLAFFILTHGFDLVRPYVFPGKNMDQIKTFRGRTVVYADCWAAFRQNPVIGYGFGAGERSIDIAGRGITDSTHNGLLSVAVNTGIVGLLFFGLGLYRLIRSLWLADLMGNAFAFPILVAIVVGLINSMAYPMIGSTWKYSTTSFLGIMAYGSIFCAPGSYVCEEVCLPAC